MSQKANFNFAV